MSLQPEGAADAWWVGLDAEGGDFSSVRDLIDRAAPLPVSLAGVVLVNIMDALEAVHREWGPHLDLRPELIRFDEAGACHIEMEGRDAAQTRVLGRHPYRAPEQAIRPDSMGVVSDVYALGVIAIEALTGRQPFRGGSDDDTWLRKVNHALPRLAELRPDDDWAWSDAARNVDDALWSMTEPEPERRTADIAAARTLLAARGVISPDGARPKSEALEQQLAEISARVAAADRLEAELAAERARAEALERETSRLRERAAAADDEVSRAVTHARSAWDELDRTINKARRLEEALHAHSLGQTETEGFIAEAEALIEAQGRELETLRERVRSSEPMRGEVADENRADFEERIKWLEAAVEAHVRARSALQSALMDAESRIDAMQRDYEEASATSPKGAPQMIERLEQALSHEAEKAARLEVRARRADALDDEVQRLREQVLEMDAQLQRAQSSLAVREAQADADVDLDDPLEHETTPPLTVGTQRTARTVNIAPPGATRTEDSGLHGDVPGELRSELDRLRAAGEQRRAEALHRQAKWVETQLKARLDRKSPEVAATTPAIHEPPRLRTPFGRRSGEMPRVQVERTPSGAIELPAPPESDAAPAPLGAPAPTARRRTEPLPRVTVETPVEPASGSQTQDPVMQPAAAPEPVEQALVPVARTTRAPAPEPAPTPAPAAAPPTPRRARPTRSRRTADVLWLVVVASGLLAAAAYFGTGWLTEPLGHDTAPEPLRATGEMPAPTPPSQPAAPASEPAPRVVPAPAVERPVESPIQMVRVPVPEPSEVWPGLDAEANGPRLYAGRTEVTRGQWAAMLGDPAPGAGEDGHPVTRISLWDAVRYANTLSRSAGLAACYTCEDETCVGATLAPDTARCDGFRVPAMAEWRAVGTAGWGPAPPAEGRAIFAKSGFYEPAEPCEAGPDGSGICDVYGNVLEWVWGGARGLAFRIGGSFAHPENIAGQKVAFRPGHRSPYGGLRVVRTVDAPRTRYGAWMYDAADGRFLTPNGTAVRPEADAGWALAVLATAAAPVEGKALAERLMVPPDDLGVILERLDLELDRVDAGWGISRTVDGRVALVERAIGAAPGADAAGGGEDAGGE